MSWKWSIQVSVAAIIGAAIFEAGRLTALREFVRGLPDDPAVSAAAPADTPRIGEVAMRAPQPAEKPAAEPSPPRPAHKKYADPPLIPRDRELVELTERIVSSEDLSAALALAPTAARSPRREVREAAVAMLAWFGKRAIAELTPFLADGDDGVAMEAAAEWKRIFANECGERERLDVAALVMNRLTSEAMLDELGVEDMFNEVDENLAVETLIGIIKAGNPAGAKVAKSAYDTVTGEEWKNEAAARKWMKENAADAG